MQLIDSHAHLCNHEFDSDRSEVIARARSRGVEIIINIATDPQELLLSLTLPKGIYTVGATTPHDAAKEGDLYFDRFAAHARAGDLVAIGETGLDYHYWKETAAVQQELLRRYLRLAFECSLPVVIHCREAFADFFKVLDSEKRVSGVLHCFTGTIEEAKGVVARDWYLSLSGIVTFKKSEELREVARQVPLDRLLIETDAPYLAPRSHRSKRNEPAFLIETAQCVAEARGIPLAELAAATRANAIRLFKLSLEE